MTVTYTLRLEQTLKARLEKSAERRQVSLNQLVINILENHYETSGFVDNKISFRGRTLHIRTKDVPEHVPGMPVVAFYIDDRVREQELAHYVIGFTTQFIHRLGLNELLPIDLIKEIGSALIHFHNARGRDITDLKWGQFPGGGYRRFFQVQDLKTIDGSFITSVEQFLAALKENQWVDEKLIGDELYLNEDDLVLIKKSIKEAEADLANFLSKHPSDKEYCELKIESYRSLVEAITAKSLIKRSSSHYSYLSDCLWAGETHARNNDNMVLAKEIFELKRRIEASVSEIESQTSIFEG